MADVQTFEVTYLTSNSSDVQKTHITLVIDPDRDTVEQVKASFEQSPPTTGVIYRGCRRIR